MTCRRAILAIAGAAVAASCGDPAPSPPVVCEEPPPARSVQGLQCGPTLDFVPINSYQGAIAAVQEREDAVALINGSCTGTLIAAAAGPVVMTAGHCVRLGDTVVVAFNVEDDPDGDPLVTEGMVIEQADEPDYALIRLGTLPAAAPVLLTTRTGGLLGIIQHPRGRPKVIAEGDFLDACDRRIYYVDLDTLVGSSGAGVLNDGGHLIGVHTDGDCDTDGGGANRGWTAEAIVEASPHLEPADLAER